MDHHQHHHRHDFIDEFSRLNGRPCPSGRDSESTAVKGVKPIIVVHYTMCTGETNHCTLCVATLYICVSRGETNDWTTRTNRTYICSTRDSMRGVSLVPTGSLLPPAFQVGDIFSTQSAQKHSSQVCFNPFKTFPGVTVTVNA